MNHSGNASSDSSFLNRSLFSSPPPPHAGSVASAREEFRRSSHAVDHPFTRLIASGGVGANANASFPVIDSHCHLDFLFEKMGFQGNLERFCQENDKFISPNFGGMVANFCDPKNTNDVNYRKVTVSKALRAVGRAEGGDSRQRHNGVFPHT